MKFKNLKVSFTINISEQDFIQAEKFLYDNFDVRDYRILPDTKNLYESDKAFQKLIAEKKKASRVINEYINNHYDKL
jgi:hypothetical protein